MFLWCPPMAHAQMGDTIKTSCPLPARYSLAALLRDISFQPGMK